MFVRTWKFIDSYQCFCCARCLFYTKILFFFFGSFAYFWFEWTRNFLMCDWLHNTCMERFFFVLNWFHFLFVFKFICKFIFDGGKIPWNGWLLFWSHEKNKMRENIYLVWFLLVLVGFLVQKTLNAEFFFTKNREKSLYVMRYK